VSLCGAIKGLKRALNFVLEIETRSRDNADWSRGAQPRYPYSASLTIFMVIGAAPNGHPMTPDGVFAATKAQARSLR